VKWSSYGDRRSAAVPEFLTVDWVLGQFGKSRPTAQKDFVREGLASRPWEELRGRFSRERRIRRRALSEKFRIKGNPAAQLHAAKTIAGADLCKAGRESIVRAYKEHGYRIREIAGHWEFITRRSA